MFRQSASQWKSPKSLVHEFGQKHNVSIEFATEGIGPPHNRVFTSRVKFNAATEGPWSFGETVFAGQGKSKKDAEQSAAHTALLFLEEKRFLYGYSLKNVEPPIADSLPSRKRPRTTAGTDFATVEVSQNPAGPIDLQSPTELGVSNKFEFKSPQAMQTPTVPLEGLHSPDFLPIPNASPDGGSLPSPDIPLLKELHRLKAEVTNMTEILSKRYTSVGSEIRGADWYELLEACSALFSAHRKVYGQHCALDVSPIWNNEFEFANMRFRDGHAAIQSTSGAPLHAAGPL